MPDQVFLSSQQVYLRPLEATDLERSQRWLNDPRVRHWVSNVFPYDALAEQRWFEGRDRGRPPSDIILAMCLHEGDRHIGNTGLHRIDWINRVATTGSLIGDPDDWGKGYGSESKRLLLRYAFDTLGLHRVHSEVIGYNQRSLRHLLRAGYREEGRHREAIFRDGAWVDMVQLGILEDEWRVNPDVADGTRSERPEAASQVGSATGRPRKA